MKIAIVGTGYVGLVTGTCFAEIGVSVICVDTNSEKIEALKKGVIPIYESGLEEMVNRNVKAGRLHFTTSLESCLNEVDVVFSAVGTPPDEDGSADPGDHRSSEPGKRRGAGFIRSHRRGQPGCRFSEKAGANRGKAGLCGHRPGPADDDLSEAFFRI